MSYSDSAMRYVHDISDNPEMAHNKIIARIKDNSRVLEFGSASGAMTRSLAEEKNCRVYIVEIDREAYNLANHYSDGGVCCDIQSFAWEDHLKAEEFDYILFVDVLEHLTKADEVLKRCEKYLKSDGSVLISVPNGAHNSIIIQLLQNTLTYQDTGLLDHTHVHQYVFSELERMIYDTGYAPVYMDATYIAVGKNEFDVSYKDIDPEIEEYLRKRPLGEAYQLIFEIKKREYISDNEILLEDCLGIDKNVFLLKQDPEEGLITENSSVSNIEMLLSSILSNPNDYFVKNNEIARLRVLINDIFEASPGLEECTSLVQRQFKSQEEIREKNKHISILKNDIAQKEISIDSLSETITRQEDQITRQGEQITELEKTVRDRERHIEQLLEVERTYERDRASRSYKVALGIRAVSHTLCPENSRRRFFAKVAARCIRHPSFVPIALNPRRIKKYIETVRTDGIEGVNMRYTYVENYDAQRLGEIDASNLDLLPVDTKRKKISDYEKLVFEKSERPLVSIIIPVYNQFHYTYNCLKAIKEHSGDVEYEIILADDCSSDLTRQIRNIVSGIRVIRNKENLRFLLNCNHAAKYARGKYILFLNNDTQPQENWLKPLVDLMKDRAVGMVGSKLVYADGRLQEAGGILWKDGSAWNYGNRMNPEDPEYNYVKEADYISGASIMIRKRLWKEIGGFDERFVPAYYEDTDLAFEVRKHGYKVIYQPLSVVVHFEGVSNGTDITSGQKGYQKENSKKFYEKWKEVLAKECFENGNNVLLARDRSRFKKHILVIDQYVPWHDKDAGCKCSYMYMLMFLKMGFQVTFIGDNYYKHEPYTTELNQRGIEVLYGNYYYKNWKKYIKENIGYFEYVYLQRPHIASRYIDIIKENGKAKIFYFAHDLHFVREKREYEITGNAEKLKSAEKWKRMEYDLFSKADVGHVVGSYEQKIVQKAFPEKPIRNIPLYIYDDLPQGIIKDFSQRKDLMYVGGFGHPPNIDAVLWFGREVMPLIVEKYPDIRWHVVGSKATDEINALSDNNIVIDGFLSDEDLAELYKSCRIDIVPLRFGAGVKGKVVEAAYYQIPLVTTKIGAEGLDDSMGNMCVVDGAEEMARCICSLYEDYEKLTSMSEAGKLFIEKYFTSECAEKVLRQDMTIE